MYSYPYFHNHEGFMVILLVINMARPRFLKPSLNSAFCSWSDKLKIRRNFVQLMLVWFNVGNLLIDFNQLGHYNNWRITWALTIGDWAYGNYN